MAEVFTIHIVMLIHLHGLTQITQLIVYNSNTSQFMQVTQLRAYTSNTEFTETFLLTV
jgi:hypothetical protein